MNYIKKFKLAVLLFALSTVVSACLNDEPFMPEGKDVANVVEFYTSRPFFSNEGTLYAVYQQAFDKAPEKDLEVIISYSGSGTAPQDIIVEIAKDSAAVSAYNQWLIDDKRAAAVEGGLNPDSVDLTTISFFDKLPEDYYSLASNTVTIKQGERQAKLIVKLKVDQFAFDQNYALGLTIKSASTGNVSGNFKTILYAVTPKNELDGVYTIVKDGSSYKDGAFTSEYPRTIHLVTQGPTKVAYYDPKLSAGYGYLFLNAGSSTYYGNWGAVFTFSGNSITEVTNYYGQGAVGGGQKRSGRIDPTGKNTISTDASGKRVIEVSYFMTQGGTGNPNADNVKASFTEKFVYVGSRPD